MHGVYELKEMLCNELEEYGKKDQLDVGSLDIVDKLAHAIKNLDKIIENYDEEQGYSDRGYSRANRGGRNYSNERGRNTRRDSRGRFSSRNYYDAGYSMAAEDMAMQLRDMLNDAPNDQIRMKIEKLMRELEA